MLLPRIEVTGDLIGSYAGTVCKHVVHRELSLDNRPCLQSGLYNYHNLWDELQMQPSDFDPGENYYSRPLL